MSWSICTSDIKWYINRSINHYLEINGMGIHVSLFRKSAFWFCSVQQHCQGLFVTSVSLECSWLVFSAAKCMSSTCFFITRTHIGHFPKLRWFECTNPLTWCRLVAYWWKRSESCCLNRNLWSWLRYATGEMPFTTGAEMRKSVDLLTC